MSQQNMAMWKIVCVLGFAVSTRGFPAGQVRGIKINRDYSRVSTIRDLWNPFAGPELTGVPIIDAVVQNSAESVKLAITLNPSSVNEKDKGGNNVMHIVAKQGHYRFPPEPENSIPRQLIKAGVDINAVNTEGRTPLTVALLSGWQRIAMILLDSGADRSAVTEEVKAKITCPDCKRVVKQYNL